MLWQRYSKNKLKAIHNKGSRSIECGFAVAKVFKEQIESNSQPTYPAAVPCRAVAKVFKEQIESNSQQSATSPTVSVSCGKGIQRTN